jgi:putative hemolysin
MVTLNDLVEAIVGNIDSSENIEEPMIIEREDGSWLLDGLLSIDEVKNLLDKESLPHEDTGNYHTLGGFIINFLGYIPTSSEYFDWQGLRFEIVDMDGTRVDKILVKYIPHNEIINQAKD